MKESRAELPLPWTQERQLTKEEAIALGASDIWKEWSDDDKVKFQLYQECLAMDFSAFHAAVEKVLDRPVWTHEFGSPHLLRQEFEGIRGKPTAEEIFALLPADKTIVAVVDD